MQMQCFIDVKVNFEKKNLALPIEKCSFLILASNTIMLQHLIIQFSLYYLSSGRLREVKIKGEFHTFSSREVAVAYKRWSLTRKYCYLTWKLLVFWKTGRLREMVAYESKEVN